MTGKTNTRISVVCALGKQPEFIAWITKRVRADRMLSRRVDFMCPRDDDERNRLIAKADVYAAFMFSEQLFKKAPNLKWLHLGLAGVDSAIFPAIQRSPVQVTSSRGLHDETVPMAAWAFVLSFATGLHEGYRQKSERKWDRKVIVLNRVMLSRQHMLIVGTGRIGTGIAKLAKQSEMEVWGVRRSLSKTKPAYFDRVLTQRGLHKALQWADYVVLATPGGAGTAHLIGANELKQMKSTAYLVNIARGSVIDEPALVKALKTGKIAGAGLDVFSEEPLPANHPLYALPNVAFTPHTSGDTIDYPYRAADLFLTNLRRYVAKRPLINLIDKRKGY